MRVWIVSVSVIVVGVFVAHAVRAQNQTSA